MPGEVEPLLVSPAAVVCHRVLLGLHHVEGVQMSARYPKMIERLQHVIREQANRLEHSKTVAHGYAETIARQDAVIKALNERIAGLENGEAIAIQYIRTLEGAEIEARGRIADLEEANASRGKTRPITKEQWAENFK